MVKVFCLLYLSVLSTLCAGRLITLRLRRGPNKISGVLEVKVGRLWGTVCDDHFNKSAADVACRQLGHVRALWYSYAGHPNSTIAPADRGIIWMDEVACKGNETSLEQCRTKEWGKHNCIHHEDVILLCYPHMRIQTRIDQGVITEGVIEVKYDGRWGGVCSSTFDNAAAYVTCVEMGFVTGEVVNSQEHSKNVWLDPISCTGNEQSIVLCDNGAWESHSCNSTAVIRCYAGDPNIYDIRLTGGRDLFSGLLEIKYLNVWGTVCHNEFDNNAATVACREMGFTSGKFITNVGSYSEAKDENYKIWLDGVECNGNEATLNDCVKNNWGIHNCKHWQDVVVECLSQTHSLATYHLKLLDGLDQYYGRLEMEYAGLRYVFCNKAFESSTAVVACRHLGFDFGKEAPFKRFPILGSDRLWSKKVLCQGNESNIRNCFHQEWDDDIEICVQSGQVTIMCAKNYRYEMRLTDHLSGQLQIKHNGSWKYVCFNDVIYNPFKICSSLVDVLITYTMEPLGPSINKQPGFPYIFKCNGMERSFSECPMYDAVEQNCTNYGNYHITCNKYSYQLALVGGSKPSSGTLVLYRDTQLISDTYSVEIIIVCNETFTNLKTAHMVCKYFGYEYGRYLRSGEINSYTLSRNKASDVLGGSVYCETSSLSECDHSFTFGDCALSGGIMNNIEMECYQQGQYDLGLVRETDEEMDRVEIFLNGKWGYLCLKDKTDDAAAMLACNKIGFSHGTQLLSNAHQTVSCNYVGKIWLDNVQCLGNETELEQCQHGPWGKPSCDLCNVLHVSCWNNLHLRSTGFDWPYVTSGFVEIEYQGIWGTVCNDMFDDNAAIVVCKEIGFHMGKVYSQVHNCVGDDIPIWFSRVNCIGTETSLGLCEAKMWANTTCSHKQDVFVQCWNDNADEFAARMVDGEKTNRGFLEVFYNGEWGTVCERGFNVNNFAADVACRNMGYTSGLYHDSRQYMNIVSNVTGKTIWLDKIDCIGREDSLLQCKRNPWGLHECDHDQDVFIKCFDDDYMLRIKGGNESRSGRLEIKYRGRWGRVCRRPLHIEDKHSVIHVACRQMGYLSGADIQKKLHDINGEYEGMDYDQYLHDQENVPIWVEYITCNGNEPSLSMCNIHIGEQKGHCQYSYGMQDLFIRCWNAELRLVGGQNHNLGRLEVKYAEKWGTICDDLFEHNNNAAIVACVQMGYKSGQYLSREDHMISHMINHMPMLTPATPIWLDDISCNGQETKLPDCNHIGWGIHNCIHSEDVFIECFDP